MNKFEVLGIIIGLCTIGSCIFYGEENRARCQPICEPYIYHGVAGDGRCICDMTKFKKEVR